MADAPKPPTTTPKEEWKPSPLTIVWLMVAFLPTVIFYAGAAKLSYDKFRSIGWAIVAFLFAPIYYMYYAFFVSTPATPVMVAAARRAWRM